jgi:hydrogenase maturation protease
VTDRLKDRPSVAVVALGDPMRHDDGLALRVMVRVRTLIGEIGCTRSARSGPASAKGASILGRPRDPSATQGRTNGRTSRRDRPRETRSAASVLLAATGNPGKMIEWIEGGTDPKRLDPLLADRKRVVLLDAVTIGSKPGTVHHWHLATMAKSGLTAIQHYNGKSEVGLKHLALWLEDELPIGGTDLIGVEPFDLSEGTGLSRPISRRLPDIVAQVASVLLRILDEEGW